MESPSQTDPYAERIVKIRGGILRYFPVKDKNPRRPLLLKALEDAEFHHRGQVRKSGEPVIIHPYRVALLVAEAGMDIESVIIALLHDVIEDTEVTREEVAAQYGDWLSAMVDGLTKVSAPKGTKQGDRAAIETYRKLLTSTVKDLRTLQVKIFDRLDNMRDLGPLQRVRQRRIAMETMIVYVPMAQRLGMEDISAELTTLSFRYMYPKRFADVLEKIRKLVKEDATKAKGLKNNLSKTLTDRGLGEMTVKPLYIQVSEFIFSTRPIEKALKGFQICVPSSEACYGAMGAMHMNFRVVPGTIKDYISNPKPSRYRALESRIFIGGETLRIEIFSHEMEGVNRTGILADWKARKEELSRYYQSYLELLEQFQGNEDLRMDDVLRYAQMDIMQIFTPEGEVLTFPQGSSVLDFAFAIHSDLGLQCTGAVVDGRRVNRWEELKDGSMVRVLTDAQVIPTETWMEQVRTTKARMQIRRFLKIQRMALAEEGGHRLFDALARRMQLDPQKLVASPAFKEGLKADDLTLQTFFQQIGTRKIKPHAFLLAHNLSSQEALSQKGSGRLFRMFTSRSPRFDLIIPRDSTKSFTYAQCCSPLSGDHVVGLPGEMGIEIHRDGCEALNEVEEELLLRLEWETESKKTAYHLKVEVQDEAGLIYKIGKIMRDLKVNIENLEVERHSTPGMATIKLKVEPISPSVYQKIVSRLRTIREVTRISS